MPADDAMTVRNAEAAGLDRLARLWHRREGPALAGWD